MIGVETLSLLHFITGTREEMEGNIMGEAEEERNEAEEEKLVGEEMMEEMEQEGRKRRKKRFSSHCPLPPLPLPSPIFLSPLLLSSPSSPLLSLHLPSLSWPLSTSWRVFLPHTDTKEQNKSKL